MGKRKKSVYLSLLIFFLTACTAAPGAQNLPESKKMETDTGFVATGPESYDSFDIPLVVGINEDDRTIRFLNLDLGKQYTLNIDGTSKFYDKYGQMISLAQLRPGDLADVTFLKGTKHLVSLKLSADSWEYEDVEKYEINTLRKEVSIGSGVYRLSEYAQFFSGGRKIDAMELNSADILTFRGIDNTVLCVDVEKGHGYLRLMNGEQFIGGWIELGQKQIQRITEDMLITAPEGSYQVTVSYKGNGGTRDVIINRDEETILDIGDFEIAEIQEGTVLFSLTPPETKLYIDGEVTDPSQPITLEYGIHQLIARADGYQTLTRYLRVGEPSAAVSIELDPDVEMEEESSASTGTVSGNDAGSGNSSSGSSESSSSADTTTSYYKVYIDSPKDAEVYVDGSYVGIAPVSFKKTEGTHVVILRRNGYETRSYTIQVDDEKKDISYSFSELEPSSGTGSSLESVISEALDAILNGN